MIGKTISHYKILEKLGEGGMGVVYKAEDIKLKRIVALKFLPPELTRDKETKTRFMHEAQAASALQHNHICNIHDIDETDDGRLFIVMDCYEGKSLKGMIACGPMKLEEALDIAIQIARGLGEAHEKGIVHRDIKPANIMITAKGEVKIMDFGLAKLAGKTKLTKTGFTAGTVQYMSPEQARGEKVDHRSDIWSLGAVLYEMITGQSPFNGEYEQSVMYSILNEEPEPLTALRTGVPMELERITLKLLAKNPDERYQHMDELIVDLRKVSPKTATQASIPKRRSKLVRVAVPVVLALIVLYFLLPFKRDVHSKSIAVLPFQNLSSEGPNAYFAGGLHDELLTQLSKVAALKVISRTSVMGYEDTKTPLKQIASELGVRSIVEGSVQVVGERLRVNVQLIDAATDEHLWAERYDRTLDDAFEIQSDVAQKIVVAIGAALSNIEQQGLTTIPTANTEAYRLFMQGGEYHARPGNLRQNYEIAQGLYERALVLDPGFALAHVALSKVHGGMYWYRYDSSPARVAQQREEAETALRLAPDLPEAHAAMGLLHYWGHRNYQQALEEFATALKRLPNNSNLWAMIGYIHRRLGNWEEVIEAFKKATQLDPLAVNHFFNLGAETYQVMHRYADAVRECERTLNLAPDFHAATIRKGWTYVLWQGQLDTLRTIVRRLPRDVELGDFGSRAFQQIELLYLERKADSLLQELLNMSVSVFETQDLFWPRSLYIAWAHQLRSDPIETRAAFGSALVLLDSVLRELPEDWRVHAALGLTLTGLGRRDEAIREANWLQQSEIYREDALQGSQLAENRAQILAQAGEAEAAIDEIERLLTKPSFLSVHTLRLDPSWDPIRDHPRFKALLTKYAMH